MRSVVEDMAVILSEWLVVDVQGARFVPPFYIFHPLQLTLEVEWATVDVTGSKDHAGSVCGRMCWHDMGRALYAATGARGAYFIFIFSIQSHAAQAVAWQRTESRDR